MKNPAAHSDGTSPRRESPARVLIALTLVVAATLRAAWSTMDRYFLGDDFAYVGRFIQLKFSEWPSLFVNDWSGGVWGAVLPELRPFAALTFLIDGALWGTNPLGYHLTNFFLDTGCALLVFLIVWRLHEARLWAGCIAAVLFAWHPTHAEPVAWITGRVDLLGTLAYLGCFFCGATYLRQSSNVKWLALSIASFGIGCFSKEFCLTAPLAIAAWAIFFRTALTSAWRRHALHLFVGCVVIVVIVAVCRHIAFSSMAGRSQSTALFSAEFAERQFDYLRWYWTPLYDFGRDYRPQLAAIATPLVVMAGFLSIAILALWHWRGPTTPRWRAWACYGLVWYLIATLPMAAASYFSPRHLYLASAGLSIALGVWLTTFSAKRWWACGASVVVMLYHLACFDQTAAAWRHSAKLSERLIESIHAEIPKLGKNEVLLIDTPDVFEGVAMWSWATPFALQPPFTPPTAKPILASPNTYFSPGQWVHQRAFLETLTSSHATLIRADAAGLVSIVRVDEATFSKALSALQTADETNPFSAWRKFIAALQTP
ncbi:hypothetical protein [Oleiharenicola lentus]|uniref:hypothetical protein n=1 Tax=Oleiharenicola lentus TaxID=2508720 RepID=UPI003F676FAB